MVINSIRNSFNKIVIYMNNIGRNEIYLGRWNLKNYEKNMDWGNSDHCYQSFSQYKQK